MKILHIATLVTPDGAYGGPVRVAVNQVRTLVEAGHDVTLAAGARGFGAALPAEYDGVDVKLFPAHTLMPKTGFAGLWSPRMLRWLRGAAESYDVAHIHLARDLITLPAARILRRARTPYVTQTHGMIDESSNPLSRPLDALLTRPVLTGARTIFSLTPDERHSLEQLIGSSPRIVDLPNGVPQLNDAQEHSIADSDEVLFLARLHPPKRPELFAKVAVAAVRRGTSFRFSIVGPDEGSGRAVAAIVDDSGLSSVRIEGPVEPQQAADRMAQCAIYVLPSVDEPFPMSVLEALSLGKPVVITESCGLADAVRDAEAGIVIGEEEQDLADAIDLLVNDHELRRRMGSNASALALRSFSMTSVAERLQEVYARG